MDFLSNRATLNYVTEIFALFLVCPSVELLWGSNLFNGMHIFSLLS
jgi:hypothetical protein